MSIHNIDFYGETWKIIPKLSSNTHLICSIARHVCVKELRWGTEDRTVLCHAQICLLSSSVFHCRRTSPAASNVSSFCLTNNNLLHINNMLHKLLMPK